MTVSAITVAAGDADHIEFRAPAQMARVLLRRGHDVSFVRAAVRNEFGRAPSLDVLAEMRRVDEATKRAENHSSRTIGSDHDGREEAIQRREMLKKGSARLLAALRRVRG